MLLARPAPALPTPTTITDLSPWHSESASGLGSLWKMWEGNGLLVSLQIDSRTCFSSFSNFCLCIGDILVE